MRTGTSEGRKIWQKKLLICRDKGQIRDSINLSAILDLGTGDPRVEAMLGIVWQDRVPGVPAASFLSTWQVTPYVRDEQDNAFYAVQPIFTSAQPLPGAVEGPTAAAQIRASAFFQDVGTANGSYGTYSGNWLVIARVTCGVEVSPAEWESLSDQFALQVSTPVTIGGD